jgi:uncharacterized membrane protein YqjE
VRRGHPTDSPGLLDLAVQLAGEVRRFIDQRLELFKAELKEEVALTVKSAGVLAAGTVGASVGTLFLLLALGVWIGDLMGSRPAGLAAVGGGLALVGGGLVFFAARNLKRRRLVRDTVADLRRDAEWIRHGV